LFTGDGLIQGAFFENGDIEFVKHFVNTDKLKYEKKNGPVSENMFVRMVFMMFHKMRLLPNILGLANTALLKVNKNVYALYERDMPYLLDIDFSNKLIGTNKKVDIDNLNSFSAHSKFSEQVVETLDYHVAQKFVDYLVLNENMNLLKRVRIHTKYLPIVHDFISTERSVIICDAPIVLRFHSVFENKLPVIFDKSLPTIFHLVENNNSTIIKYEADSAFYIFHYANAIESDNTVEIFAPVYENLDFSRLEIQGKYRKIVINKNTKIVSMESNPLLETMNLDFPIRYGKKTVLRNIENGRIGEFVLCEGLEIVRQIKFENRAICGEPAIIDNTPLMVCFANDINEDKSFLIIINLDTYEITEIPTIHSRLSIGFHSLFFSNNI
jgi:carotenoid cleavage dioxygenase-like enzyme